MATAEVETKAVDPAKGKGIILYDGQCRLCQRSVRILKRLDWLHRFHFQDCRDTAKLPKTATPLDPEKLLEQMHVVTPDRQRAYAGYRAFRWMAWRIPATCWLAPLMYIPGAPWLGSKLYLGVAKNRFHLLPCRDGVCELPPHGQKTNGPND
jgi:predicted DCC family thiol-disulfide oxidoreductase YuxK